jgi:hypothetical protein
MEPPRATATSLAPSTEVATENQLKLEALLNTQVVPELAKV